jgi:hypothetical protein
MLAHIVDIMISLQRDQFGVYILRRNTLTYAEEIPCGRSL